MFVQNHVENFVSDGERTLVYNSFEGLTVDVESIDKFTDSLEVEGYDDSQGHRRMSPNLSNDPALADGLKVLSEERKRGPKRIRWLSNKGERLVSSLKIAMEGNGEREASSTQTSLPASLTPIVDATQVTMSTPTPTATSIGVTPVTMPTPTPTSTSITEIIRGAPKTPPIDLPTQTASTASLPMVIPSFSALLVSHSRPQTPVIPTTLVSMNVQRSVQQRGFVSQVHQRELGNGVGNNKRSGHGHSGINTGYWRNLEPNILGQIPAGTTPYVPPRPQWPPTPPQGPRYSGQGIYKDNGLVDKDFWLKKGNGMILSRGDMGTGMVSITGEVEGVAILQIILVLVIALTTISRIRVLELQGVALALCQSDPVLNDGQGGFDPSRKSVIEDVRKRFIEKALAEREDEDDYASD
ncbi:hypothetical protein GIB67_028779 [Kingdonia uniflora]|uniref:Uncharacterized protein n=1 Tax=Kingdonia uniflora TaxID=39325 RepID=A0A7J7M266_9MAGN|nr:hypothetical protein GIB67_028779 [Kingdonia uniflora]